MAHGRFLARGEMKRGEHHGKLDFLVSKGAVSARKKLR